MLKIMIIVAVFLVSVTGMSEATEPVVNYYKNTYYSNDAYIAKIIGIVVAQLL